MPLIIFDRTAAPTGTVTFTKNPRYGIGKTIRFRQPTDMTDGGDIYSYDKGITEELFELSWSRMPEADWTALDAFIRTVAQGKKNSFTYTDEDGATHTVIIEDGTLDFREVKHQRYAGTLTLRKIA